MANSNDDMANAALLIKKALFANVYSFAYEDFVDWYSVEFSLGNGALFKCVIR